MAIKKKAFKVMTVGSQQHFSFNSVIVAHIVRTSNHVLYVSNLSRLARPNIFSVCARKEKKVWPG